MWTINYKGFYIHGYVDRAECTVLGFRCKSLHAAKILVSQTLLPAHAGAMSRRLTA